MLSIKSMAAHSISAAAARVSVALQSVPSLSTPTEERFATDCTAQAGIFTGKCFRVHISYRHSAVQNCRSLTVGDGVSAENTTRPFSTWPEITPAFSASLAYALAQEGMFSSSRNPRHANRRYLVDPCRRHGHSKKFAAAHLRIRIKKFLTHLPAGKYPSSARRTDAAWAALSSISA